MAAPAALLRGGRQGKHVRGLQLLCGPEDVALELPPSTHWFAGPAPRTEGAGPFRTTWFRLPSCVAASRIGLHICRPGGCQCWGPAGSAVTSEAGDRDRVDRVSARAVGGREGVILLVAHALDTSRAQAGTSYALRHRTRLGTHLTADPPGRDGPPLVLREPGLCCREVPDSEGPGLPRYEKGEGTHRRAHPVLVAYNSHALE